MDMESMATLLQMMMGSAAPAAENADDCETSDNAENGGEDFGDFFNNINFDMLNKMGELFSHMNKPDRNAELLIALKPHLRDENQHKIDSALKLSKMISMFPLLKDSGILNDLL